MKAIIDYIKNKTSLILTLIVSSVVAWVAFLLAERKDKINELETENAQQAAQNEIQEKEGELNEIKKQTELTEKKFESDNADLESNLRELEEFRRNHPKQ